MNTLISCHGCTLYKTNLQIATTTQFRVTSNIFVNFENNITLKGLNPYKIVEKIPNILKIF